MSLPKMVFPKGDCTKKGIVANTAQELITFAENGYWARDLLSKDAVTDMTEVQEFLEKERTDRAKEKAESDILNYHLNKVSKPKEEKKVDDDWDEIETQVKAEDEDVLRKNAEAKKRETAEKLAAKYEKETGLKAIWGNKETNKFIAWKGEQKNVN